MIDAEEAYARLSALLTGNNCDAVAFKKYDFGMCRHHFDWGTIYCLDRGGLSRFNVVMPRGRFVVKWVNSPEDHVIRGSDEVFVEARLRDII